MEILSFEMFKYERKLREIWFISDNIDNNMNTFKWNIKKKKDRVLKNIEKEQKVSLFLVELDK